MKKKATDSETATERQPTSARTAATFKAYAEVGRYFWHQIEALKPEDKMALQAYEEIGYELENLFNKHMATQGYMGELSMWAGIKKDGPESDVDQYIRYGKRLKKSYSEVFDVQEANNHKEI